MEFSELVGKTLSKISVQDDERVIFTDSNGQDYAAYHLQDCCEKVVVWETIGDLTDAMASPILEASSETDPEGDPKPDEYSESWTWTRQRIKTAKGEVTFVWLGTSNGYYGENVYFGLT